MTKRIAFIGQYSEQLLFETVLDTFDHDVVLLEPVAHAYTQIKRVAPDLIIVCLAEGDMNGCRLLSMLALDRETARIPCLMYLTPAPVSGTTDSTDCAHRASSYFSSVALN
jgi:CheY-like chemotaxis protein